MLITNIKKFVNTHLFSCKKSIHEELLFKGFEPVYVEDGVYYYILNDKLKEVLNNLLGGETIEH